MLTPIAQHAQEIEILRQLRHENIIQMLDAFETKTEFCVVTEFAHGELFEILEDDQSLPEDVVQAGCPEMFLPSIHQLSACSRMTQNAGLNSAFKRPASLET